MTESNNLSLFRAVAHQVAVDCENYKDIDVNFRHDGFTILHNAAKNGTCETITSLLKNGAKIDALSSQGNTPLTEAVLASKSKNVKVLLENGADPNLVEENGKLPLMAALIKGDLEIVQMLVKNGANVNPDVAQSPLITSIEKGYKEICNCLLEGGANVNKPDEEGNTPLSFAVEKNDKKLVELLLEHGGNFCAQSVFLKAISKKNSEIVQLLINSGAKVNVRYRNGSSPLIAAIEANSFSVVDKLIENGADVKMDGVLLITKALQLKHRSILSLLWCKGCAKNFKIEHDFPFLECKDMKIKEIVKILVSGGKDPNTVCDCGYTFLTKFLEMEDFEMAEFLVRKGADVNKVDKNSNVPLLLAASKRNCVIFNFLVQAGAHVKVVEEELKKIAQVDESFAFFLEPFMKDEKSGSGQEEQPKQ